jgi:hypothetical protein
MHMQVLGYVDMKVSVARNKEILLYEARTTVVVKRPDETGLCPRIQLH